MNGDDGRAGTRSAERDRLRRGRFGAHRGAVVAGLAVLIALGALAWRAGLFTTSADAASAMASGRYAQAVSHYTRDAQGGDPQALTALGNLHYLGLGTAQDPGTAARLYHRAASVGHAPAQINLGNLYAQGLGVPENALRAFGWYSMASIHGSAAAEYYLYQISVEYTLSPLQQSTAAERWRTLERLMAEPL